MGSIGMYQVDFPKADEPSFILPGSSPGIHSVDVTGALSLSTSNQACSVVEKLGARVLSWKTSSHTENLWRGRYMRTR